MTAMKIVPLERFSDRAGIMRAFIYFWLHVINLGFSPTYSTETWLSKAFCSTPTYIFSRLSQIQPAILENPARAIEKPSKKGFLRLNWANRQVVDQTLGSLVENISSMRGMGSNSEKYSVV